MHKLFRGLIDRLRHFMRSKTLPPTSHSDVSLAAANDDHLERLDIALITRRGIRFKGVRFNGPTIPTLLNDLGRPKAKAVIKWDASDCSCIGAWNGAASPNPSWVKVPAVDGDFCAGISFIEHERIRRIAKDHAPAFFTEEERSKAREILQEHWKNLAERAPVRESHHSRRAVDYWEGTGDDDLWSAEASAGERSPRVRKLSKRRFVSRRRRKAFKKPEATIPGQRVPHSKSK